MFVCRPDELKDLSKSTANESQGGRMQRPSNSVPQRPRRMPAGKHTTDGGSGACGTHEEWETASESSDILKDSDSQHQQSSARADKPAGSRRESKRGYSNQRHTQSRRGRQRDRPGDDSGGGVAATQQAAAAGSVGSAGVDARPMRTNAAPAAPVNSTRPSTFPPGDRNGPDGNIHPVYRMDQVIFDDPGAVQTAFANVFRRFVY